MPERKSQHYVPQFYLRQFATDPKGRKISLYNLNSNKFISGKATITHEACEDYFYGHDKLMEEGFGFIEGETSKVLEEVISKTTPPKYFTHEHTTIITFTLLLHARTKYSAEVMEEMFDQVAKKILSKDPRIKEETLNKIKIGFEYPAQAPVGIAAEQIMFGFDLGFKLLINNTSTPFITSDEDVPLAVEN